MNAVKTSTACKVLYERLKANGKNGKQTLVAVINVKNNCSYKRNYCSAKSKNL